MNTRLVYSKHSLGYPGEIREIGPLKGESPQAKIADMRKLIDHGAEDPIIHELAAKIVFGASRERDPHAQAAALLAYVQRSVFYLGERAETFQTARYSAEHRTGDCDDATILFCSLCESILIPTRIELIGWPNADGVFEWRHVYARVGLPPSNPTTWLDAECTMDVPLGWSPKTYVERNMGSGGQF